MPLDLSNLSPAVGSGMPARKSTRTTGPNPFLDGFPGQEDPMKGTLWDSYQNEQDYTITVQGGYEDSVIQKGPRTGEPTQRLTGDAATVVSMLRTAANKLDIGCSISITAGKRKGTLAIQYLGKERKNYGRQDEEEYEEGEED